MLHFYLISTRAQVIRGICKFGYHKGTKKQLRKRYITALPQLIICLFLESKYGKVVEFLIKEKFNGARIINSDSGKVSEWIQCDIKLLIAAVTKLVAAVNQPLDEFFVTNCNEVTVTRKRKQSPVQETMQSTQVSRPKKVSDLTQCIKVSSEHKSPHIPVGICEEYKTHAAKKDPTKQLNEFENALEKNIEKMELNDPRAKEVFLAYISSLEPPAERMLDPSFLRPFVSLLLCVPVLLEDGKVNPFIVSLDEVAKLYVITAGEFARLIVGRADHPTSDNEFVFGRDFITNGKGSPNYKKNAQRAQYYFYMTTTCFAKASMIYQGKKAKQIRQYFELVNRALMNHVGESIWKRLNIEEPHGNVVNLQRAKIDM